ncbi:MAG: RAD55 family ATPase [Candidatus Hydrothermarchaeota archaeon]
MKKVSTGIDGLDEILDGGIPEKSIILISGGPGSGKSIFCVQFLIAGINSGENGVYVTFEERIEKIKRNMKTFGWDLEKLEGMGKLGLLSLIPKRKTPLPQKQYQVEKETQPDGSLIAEALGAPKSVFTVSEPFHIDTVTEIITEKVKKTRAKRIVIDSLSSLELQISDDFIIRQELLGLFNLLEDLGCTTLVTTEMPYGSDKISRFGIEEFMTEGVIVLYNFRHNDKRMRAIEVLKMRGMKFREGLFPLKITDKGIVVFPEEKVFGA